MRKWKTTSLITALGVSVVLFALAGVCGCSVEVKQETSDCVAERDCKQGRICELGRCVFEPSWSDREKLQLEARLLGGLETGDLAVWDVLAPTCADWQWLYGESLSEGDCARLAERWNNGARTVLENKPEGVLESVTVNLGEYAPGSSRDGGPVRPVEVWKDNRLVLHLNDGEHAVSIARMGFLRGRLRILSWELSSG